MYGQCLRNSLVETNMTNNIPKRESWDSYFLKVAALVATRSRDNSVQVGAVLVNPLYKSIISTGYNDFPAGIDDDKVERRERPAKYLFTEHAERNAIYLAARHGISTEYAWMYISQGPTPCTSCTRAIIQAGIHSIIVPDVPWEGSDTYLAEMEASSEMLKEAMITVYKVNV